MWQTHHIMQKVFCWYGKVGLFESQIWNHLINMVSSIFVFLMNIPHQLIVHLPELITTMISTTPILTTTLKTTTTVPTKPLVITTIPTTTLVITTIPTTKLSSLRATLKKRTSQPFTTPVNSPDVSSTFNYQRTKITKQFITIELTELSCLLVFLVVMYVNCGN